MYPSDIRPDLLDLFACDGLRRGRHGNVNVRDQTTVDLWLGNVNAKDWLLPPSPDARRIGLAGSSSHLAANFSMHVAQLVRPDTAGLSLQPQCPSASCFLV
jgi:hypothetical protein